MVGPNRQFANETNRGVRVMIKRYIIPTGIVVYLLILLCAVTGVHAAQQAVTTFTPGTGTSGMNIGKYTIDYINPRLTKINDNDTDLYTNKADKSCFANSTAFNACFSLDWPTGFDTAGNYTITGAWDFTGAAVTGITGDQDLSGYALTSSVLSKTNTTAFIPTADYHPATKKYVDDEITASVGTGPTLSVSAPLSLNETTGVLSLAPWASQAAFEAFLGWSFTGYTLPTATGSTLGGIKIGSGLSIDGSGVVTVTASGGVAPAGSFTFDGGTSVVAATFSIDGGDSQ